ncbi:SDR family NAD(P)-dependent oxidoreductase [Streptomyces sp. NPDC004838]
MLYADQTVLVTGGGSGIGREAALQFARDGGRVIVADANAEAAQSVAALIEERGGTASPFTVDVSREEEVVALVEHAVATFGGLDVALNNAGISGKIGMLHDLDAEEWERIQAVDLRGVFLCMKHEIDHMLSHGGGTVVNTSSVAGVIGNPGSAGYAAAKHGVVGLTRTAAGEYGANGIRVNAISPGLTRTAMVKGIEREDPALIEKLAGSIPLGRLAEPTEIAEAAVWLASPKASFVNGHVLVVDGGYSVL